MTLPGTPPGLSSGNRLDTEALLRRFEHAWRYAGPPRIEDHLPGEPGPQRRALLEELVMLDLEYRWRRAAAEKGMPRAPGPIGERPRLEEYTRCFPELGPLENLSGELIGAEYRVRRRWGDRPERTEYAARFGRQAALLTGTLNQVEAELAEIAPDRAAEFVPSAVPVAQVVPPPMTVPALVDLLCRYQLLGPRQLDELCNHLQHRYAQPRALARHLLQCGWLTAYQINQLFLNNGQGLVLGPYVLIERLGEGGAGQVFKARHQRLQRIVALKVIRRELLTDPEVVRRFYREVQLLSQLSHPNVVHAYDAGPVGDTHFLVMEHVRGVDLAKLVRDIGPLPASRAIDYACQAALGLDHIHQNGLVHRDIKPHNLLLSGGVVSGGVVSGGVVSGGVVSGGVVSGKVRDEATHHSPLTTHHSPLTIKILDLGLARFGWGGGEARLGSSLTPVGAVLMGTLDFMAPEQALDFHQADIRSDIYSLGCTLYFLLVGQAPFGGGTVAQRLLQHQQADPVPVESLRRDLPAGLDAVLRKMLAKRPEDRYQAPAEAAKALEALVEPAAARERQLALPLALWVETSPNGTPAVFATPILPEPPGRRPGPRGWRYALLAAAGLFLLGIGAMLMTKHSQLPPRTEAALVPSTAKFHRPGELIIEPEPLVWLPGTPLGKSALVSRPAPVEGARGWTIDTRGPRGAVKELAYSPNGRWLATASEDQVIRLWRPEGTTPVLRLLIGHEHFGQANQRLLLAWSPDSRYLASGGRDRSVRLWEVESGRPLRTMVLPGPVMGLAWSPDGRKLACGCQNQPAVIFLDPSNGRGLFSLEGHQGAIGALVWSPDGKALASGSEDRTIRLWDGVSGRTLQAFTGHTGSITRLAWSPDGKTLAATAQPDDAVRLWDVASGKPLSTAPNRNPGGLADLVWSPDSKTLALCDGGLRLWQPGSGRPPRSVPSGIALNAVSWSPDGKVLAAGGLPQGGGRGVVEMWDVATSMLVQTLDGHRLWNTGQNVVWSPDGRRLAAVDYPFAGVSLWDAANGQCLGTLAGHTNHCLAAAWSPDGRLMATGSLDHDVRLWDVASGRELFKFSGHTGPVTALAWSSDGKTLASGSADRTVRLWDAVSGKNPHILSGHEDTVGVLAWSPDGKKLASGGGDADRTVRVWESETGNLWFQPLAHPRGLSALGWSADGKRLGAGMQHIGAALLWNATTGRLDKELPGSQAGTAALVWLAGDTVLAATCTDRKVRQWDIQAGQLLRTTDLPHRGTLSPDRRTLAGLAWPLLRLWDADSARTTGAFLLLDREEWLSLTAEGQYRASATMDRGLVVVVQTEGSQELLSPSAFARRFRWKNDPKRVTMAPNSR